MPVSVCLCYTGLLAWATLLSSMEPLGYGAASIIEVARSDIRFHQRASNEVEVAD